MTPRKQRRTHLQKAVGYLDKAVAEILADATIDADIRRVAESFKAAITLMAESVSK